MALREKQGDMDGQVWNLGQMVCIRLLMKEKKAWDYMFEDRFRHLGFVQVIKETGDAIVFEEKKHGIAEGFAMAQLILHKIEETKGILGINSFDVLRYLLIGLLEMKVSAPLLKDVCGEIQNMHSDSTEINVMVEAILNSFLYAEGGQKESFLQKLHPDMAIAVESIVREAKL